MTELERFQRIEVAARACADFEVEARKLLLKPAAPHVYAKMRDDSMRLFNELRAALAMTPRTTRTTEKE